MAETQEATVQKATSEKRTQPEGKKRTPARTLIRVLLTVVLILLFVLLILFVVSRAANYSGIPAMLQDMGGEMAAAWQRFTA